jgi:MYXO-CTERM domain-containing protein
LTSNGDGQSADGFGCHPNQAGDTGNVFRGCRAWWNTDDGWDFINASAACTVENSWTWYNGYKPDAISNGAPVSLSSGNGNGFKGGGYGMPPSGVPSPTPQHVLRFNVALYNKAAGFYTNHSPNNAYFYNNTGFHNAPDFNLLGVASDGSTSISVGILRNNLAFAGSLTSNADLGGLIDAKSNSWDKSLGLTITEADFQSVAFAPPASCPAAYSAGGTVCVPPTDTTSFAGMAGARQADGSLPVLPFLRPSAGSHVIDKGENIGFAFVGVAPDLGAFEYGASGGSGGGTGSGGQSGAGGTPDAGARVDGSPASTGGAAAGGRQGGGGATAAGGGAGGASPGLGGNPGTGGARADGGPVGVGGLVGADGSAQGGFSVTGGATTGATGPGGAPGGATGTGAGNAGGTSATGGRPGAGSATSGNSGCACGVARKPAPPFGPLLLLLGALLLHRRRPRA